MKKVLSLFLMFFFSIMVFSQLRPIAQKISDSQIKKVNFEKINPFILEGEIGKQTKYRMSATDANVLRLQPSELVKVVKERPKAIELSLPYNDAELTVEMVQNDIFEGKELIINTDKGLYKDYKPGVYYQGIIKGDNKSVVAISFFDDDVVGVVSLAGGGNVIIGKALNADDYVIYTDNKLTGINPFICKTDELLQNEKEKISYNPKTSKGAAQTQNVVRVYYEVCYNPFVQNNSNVTTTTNWLTAIHNNVATLYINDGIRTAMHELFIWTTQDPYNSAPGNHSQNLSDFRANRPDFNGDLAHLVNYPSTTSVAYVNSLCGFNSYAYSGVDKMYQNIPAYSWTIMAMTHEMGHALGSPHTHACAWNGNNTPIDGCAPAYKPDLAEGNCATGPIPAKGTIMSYCHLLPSVGVDFTLGFGEQPSALIRETVDSKACLNTDGQTGCPVSITALILSNFNKTSVTGTIVDNTSLEWRYQVVKMDGTIVKSGVTTNKVVDITALVPNTYYEFKVGSTCGSTNAYQQNQLFLTDADWCEEAFVDTGGENGDYKNNQYFTKTFYPAISGQKLKLTFTEFDLENGNAFMTVRNGPTAGYPVFSGGLKMTGSTIKGPFESTHITGAITVVFQSGGGKTAEGWVAGFECKALEVRDINDMRVSVTPNPTRGPINIKLKSNIDSITIYDAAGKILNTQKDRKSKEKTVDLSDYPAGIYIVSVKSGNEVVTKKIIKK